MKDSFVLYTRYGKHIKKLDMEQRGVLVTAILDYMAGEEIPEMETATDMIFGIIKDDIDENNAKWERTKAARVEAGRLGGSKSKQKEAKQANASFAKQTEAKQAVYVNVNGLKEKEISKEKEKQKRFVPPTVDEVKAYCQERKNKVSAEAFVDFYESKGWMVGKNKMKDWRSAVRNWERREAGRPPTTSKTPEPPKYPDFKPTPKVDSVPMPEEIRKTLQEIF